MIMARSVLEVIITEKIQSPANEHGKDKTLNAKLRDAAKEGVISKQPRRSCSNNQGCR